MLKYEVQLIDNLEALYRDALYKMMDGNNIGYLDIYLHRAWQLGIESGLTARNEFEDADDLNDKALI